MEFKDINYQDRYNITVIEKLNDEYFNKDFPIGYVFKDFSLAAKYGNNLEFVDNHFADEKDYDNIPHEGLVEIRKAEFHKFKFKILNFK